MRRVADSVKGTAMSSATNSLLNTIDFLVVMTTTWEYHQRRRDYEQHVSELAEGEVLVAYCERYCIEPRTIEVNDFFEYNNTIGLLDDPFTAVYSIEWFHKTKKRRKRNLKKRQAA